MAEPVKLEIGLKLSIPVIVQSLADRSNIMVQAGARTVLLEAEYLESSSEVLAPAPPPPEVAVEGRLTRMETLLADLAAKLSERLSQPAEKPHKPGRGEAA